MLKRRVTRTRRKSPGYVEALENRQLLAADPIADGQPVIISEVMPDNNSSLVTRTRATDTDPFEGPRERLDWIELMNISSQSIDVGGMHLTDDQTDLTKWELPAGTSIAPGEFLIVFASGDNITDVSLDEHGSLHTNFRLSDEGEYLALTNAEGGVVHEFAPTFPAVRVDVSVAVAMEDRTLIGEDAAIEYAVPTDNSLDPGWRQADFGDPSFTAGTSPVGFDRGDGPAEFGQLIGNELFNRDSTDFSSGSMVVMKANEFTEAGRLNEWSFYSTTTKRITPLLFRAAGEEFEIVGIGATRRSDGNGAQTYPFDLQSGTDIVASEGYFFGTKDGDNIVNERGVVKFDPVDNEAEVRRYNGPNSGRLVVGNTLTGGRDFDRRFSVNASTAALLAGPINTVVDDEMADSDSLYIRYSFAADQVEGLRLLELDVRYEDGFVAYLNGVEVARRNAPVTPAFDSSATANQTLQNANLHETINISAFRSQLVDGQNMLAIHGLNSAEGPAEFIVDARLSGISIDSVTPVYVAIDTTPGAPNGEVFDGFVPSVEFSTTRGFFEDAFDLELSVPDVPDVMIYYSTDGTQPGPDNPSSILYDQPINIADTSFIRAIGYQAAFVPSVSVTQTYIFPTDVATQPDMFTGVTEDPTWGPQVTAGLLSLPTVSIVTGKRINVMDEIPTSMEMFYPERSQSLHVNAGIEVYGGTAVSFPKQSLRVSFKDDYGPEILDYDLFDDPDGVTEFDQILLRPGSHDTPFATVSTGAGVYIRNRWVHDQQLAMGQLAPRGRFVHVYVNGEYRGFYQLTERPNASFMASHLGGTSDDYDALNAGRAIDGDTVAWNQFLETIDDGWESVESQLDVVGYADYILLQWYGGNNIDWRHDANWMAARPRSEDGRWIFFGWDSDIVLRSGAFTDIVNLGGPGFIWTRNGGIQQYPEFREILAERAQLHFFDGGVFTDDHVRESLDAIADPLRLAVIPETARWVQSYTPASWEDGIQWIKDTYIPPNGPSRAETVIQQMQHAGLFPLSDAPTAVVNGQSLTGEVSQGDELTLAVDEGTIYYTTDGTDPKTAFPTLNYTNLVSGDSPARIYVPTDSSLQKTWTMPEFDDSAWIEGTNGAGFDVSTEQTLAPFVEFDIAEQMHSVSPSMYARLAFDIDDPNAFDSLELSVRYDDGTAVYLNGQEVARRNAVRSTVLWLATEDDVAASSGVDGVSAWTDATAIAVSNVDFEPGTLAGNFRKTLDLTPFSTSADRSVEIEALHVVNQVITIGQTDSLTLVEGDVILVTEGDVSLIGSDAQAINVTNQDVFVFRPDKVGDYSAGSFFVLMRNPLGGGVSSVTLVEQDVEVGDTRLPAGTFLATGNSSPLVQRLDVDAAGEAGSTTVRDFFDLGALGVNGVVDGLDVVEQEMSLGSNLAKGHLVIAFEASEQIDGQTYRAVDVVKIAVATTTLQSGSSSGSAELLIDGSVLGFDTPAEAIDSISFNVNEPRWNSKARAGHDNIESQVFEPFNLTPWMSLLTPGKNVLAIHGMNAVGATNVDFLSTPVLRAGTVTDAGISPNATAYDGPLTLQVGGEVLARTLWGDQWSPLRRVATPVESFPLRITEIMYHPGPVTEAESAAGFGDEDFEFIEFANASKQTIDLNQVRLEQENVLGQNEGVTFNFSEGDIERLGPDERVLVVENRSAFVFRYGEGVPVTGEWGGGRLRNSSEQLTVTVAGQELQKFFYDDSWYPETDGTGPSLEIIDAHADIATWSSADAWRASAINGGTPGIGDIPGDSNRDGNFDEQDLVFVFIAGEYEDGIDNNSTFEEGDWNHDGDFDSDDIVFAFIQGTYNPSASPRSFTWSDNDLAAARLSVDEIVDNESDDEWLQTIAEQDHGRRVELQHAARDLIFRV